ncbi:MAG: DNA ligase D [Proteobacteria bacterium]|nr:DNA ligase D [Pseudomonadota bacterium]
MAAYQAKRDFTATPEPPPPAQHSDAATAPLFVVQKHVAHRAGLHWDFRLEHDGVLWSWAVRRGPSMDPADKRLAAHVEDHPIDYAGFEGNIPDGHYGAGDVTLWDRGTWTPQADPRAGLRAGEIKFTLHGGRLNGGFVLVRLRPRSNRSSEQDNWLLIKERDRYAQPGADAGVLEAKAPAPGDGPQPAPGQEALHKPVRSRTPMAQRPAPGAVRRAMPTRQEPQLATLTHEPPEAGDWLGEIKFDGYRIIASCRNGRVRLITRNGLDWTDRLPAVAAALRSLGAASIRVDGELVALDKDGVSSFPALQAALSAGRDDSLLLYLFDLLYIDGWDLRRCTLRERKGLLLKINEWQGLLRYSDHQDDDVSGLLQAARRMKLEGIVCKRADAPYSAGRGGDWLKLKTRGREEFVVLGWTDPSGRRVGLGSLHLGYYDEAGDLHYAGGCGSGYTDDVLERLQLLLPGVADGTPPALLLAGEDIGRSIHWVRPELVAEVAYAGWSGAGRLRQASFLGLREDKAARDVVRPVANADEARRWIVPAQASRRGASQEPVIAVPQKRSSDRPAITSNGNPADKAARPRAAASRPSGSAGQAPHPAVGTIVTAVPPRARTEAVAGVTLTHPAKPLWPGISKRDLVSYWEAVADHALPGLVRRPLAVVRCPDGIEGEHFFQKHSHGAMPDGVRDGSADGAPYMAIDDFQGLVALVQMSTLELHAWGAHEDDPLHPDQLVFDLDPGEGVSFADVVAAAHELRAALEALGLAVFCRTTGGKGLHLVVPLKPEADWNTARAFCKAFAEGMSALRPERYLSTVRKTDRRGRILIDWLRNGLGSTAVASFCPRARPGAGVAAPLRWDEVVPALDPTAFTIATMPERLARQRRDPWAGFEAGRRSLTPVAPKPKPTQRRTAAAKGSQIVAAAPPRRSVRKSAKRTD